MERRMDRRERERERFRQQQQQQQQQQHHQSNLNDRVDLDARTPLAWQRRDFNYHHNSSSSFNERYPEGVPSSSSDRYSHPSLGSRSARSAIGGGGHNQSEHHRGGQQQQQQQQHRGRGRAGDHHQQQTGSDDQTTSKMSVASSSRGGGERASKKTSTSSAGTASGAGGGGGGNRSNGSTAAAAASGGGGGRQHPSRSSEETTTGSASSETETDAERGQPSRPGTSGTLRSMQSMPLLSPLHHPMGAAAFNPMLGGIYGVVGLPGPPPPHMAPGNPTWNGEPCPVHGAGLHHHGQPMSLSAYPAYPPQIYGGMAPMRRAASIHELGMTTPMPALMPPPGAIYGTLQAGPPPGQFLMPGPGPGDMMMMAGMMSGPPSLMAGPPHHIPHLPPPPASSLGGRMLMRPHPMSHRSNGPSSLPPIPLPPPSSMMGGRNGRPIVVNGKNGQPEPLPVRDAPPLPPKIPPSDVVSRAASKSSSAKPFSYEACCRGNVVVLWVIMGIIGLGVVMAVVFYYAFQ